MTSRHYLITGGCGYPGFCLAKQLVDNGHNVMLMDIKEPIGPLLDNMHFIQVDIRDYGAVEEACKGVNCVFHMASYGMSGREQLNRQLIEEVNVIGTENVIKACIKHNITQLVYTSTYNVVFGGQVICNGDESLPYLPLHEHVDHYSRTKSIADQIVLDANGTTTDNGKTVCTCSLRLAGIYGPGELRHLPRIVRYLEQGLVSFVYGDDDSRVDFLHVDNMVQAHIQAAEALTDQRHHIAAGQAYFISDNKPINNFLFFKPLIEGLGFEYPTRKLPIALIYFFAFLTEWIHAVIGRVYNFQPLLTRAEVYKTGVTHYFSIAKAKHDLNYNPVKQNDLKDVVAHFRNTGHVKQKKTDERSFFVYWLMNIVIALVFASVVLSFLPMIS